MKALKGKPKKCEVCGTTDKKKNYDWANLTGKFNDPEDYKRMCRSCHRKYDKAHLNFQGGKNNFKIDETGKLKAIDLGSFERLPSHNLGEVSRGTLFQYTKAVRTLVKEILDTGKLTEKEKKVVIMKIQANKNYELTLESSKKIAYSLALAPSPSV